MSNKYFVFPTPADAVCVLAHDTGGWSLTAAPDTHPTGRTGQSFTIPVGTPQDNGASLTVTAAKMVPLALRGILHVAALSTFGVDDFILTKGNTLPKLSIQGKVFVQDE